MYKKIFLVASILVLSLTACNKKEKIEEPVTEEVTTEDNIPEYLKEDPVMYTDINNFWYNSDNINNANITYNISEDGTMYYMANNVELYGTFTKENVEPNPYIKITFTAESIAEQAYRSGYEYTALEQPQTYVFYIKYVEDNIMLLKVDQETINTYPEYANVLSGYNSYEEYFNDENAGLIYNCNSINYN